MDFARLEKNIIDVIKESVEIMEVMKHGSKNQIKKNGTEEGSFL